MRLWYQQREKSLIIVIYKIGRIFCKLKEMHIKFYFGLHLSGVVIKKLIQLGRMTHFVYIIVIFCTGCWHSICCRILQLLISFHIQFDLVRSNHKHIWHLLFNFLFLYTLTALFCKCWHFSIGLAAQEGLMLVQFMEFTESVEHLKTKLRELYKWDLGSTVFKQILWN